MRQHNPRKLRQPRARLQNYTPSSKAKICTCSEAYVCTPIKKYKPHQSYCRQLLLHSFPTIVSFRSVATLAFADPDAKKHASPAVNGRRLPPSFFGLLQPPPLLRSQAARTHSYRSPFRFSPFRPSAFPTLAQGCFTCVSAQLPNYVYWTMEIAKGYKTTDYQSLDLTDPQ